MRSSARCARSTQPNPGWRHEGGMTLIHALGQPDIFGCLDAAGRSPTMPASGERARCCPPQVSNRWRLPHAIVARCVTSCRDERGAEVIAGLIEAGLRECDGAGNCQFLDFLAHNCSRAMVEADKEREPKAGSKGGTTNVKRNRRAREAQAEGPAEPARDISATSKHVDLTGGPGGCPVPLPCPPLQGKRIGT